MIEENICEIVLSEISYLMRVLLIFVLASMQRKICNRFFTILTGMVDRSWISTGLSVNVYGGHKVLTLPATFLLAKPIL